MHHDDDCQIVQNGRKKRRHANAAVRNGKPLCHEKRSGPHDGGHDLPTCGCNGLHRSGELRPIPQSLHERYGEHSGRIYVGHGCTTDGTKKRTGYDGNLGRASPASSGSGTGQVHDYLTSARSFHDAAKNDEQHKIGG